MTRYILSRPGGSNQGTYLDTFAPAPLPGNQPSNVYTGIIEQPNTSAATGIELAADSGAFAITGYDASIDVGEPAGSASFAITGNSAGLNVGIPAGSGSFAITGNPATLIHTGNLAAGSGAFALNGYAAGLKVGLPAGSGAFNITGYAAADAVGEPLGSAAFAITGYPATLKVNMPAGSGEFNITGNPAALVSSSSQITFDPAAKDSNITLSADKLTATLSAAVSDVVVRATKWRSAGRYFETTIGVSGYTSGGPAMTVGLANTSQSLTTWLGADATNGIGYGANGFVFGPTGSSFGIIANTGTGYGAGDAIGFEILGSTAKVTKNGSLVFTFTTLPTGNLYPAVSLGNQNDSVTADFGATPLSYLPSDAVSWDGTQPVLGSGSFAITGRAAGINVGMSAGSGAFAATGHDATLRPSGPNLTAGSGAFSITGRPASFATQVTVASGTFSIAGGTLSLAVKEPLGSGAFALTGYDASMVPREGGILICAGDPISEAAIVSASLLMFRRKYPLSAQPKNTARSLAVPFDALIRREEPDFARERRRQPEYDFTNHIFEADPSNRGAYEAP